jgi:signal transduction histidine kinase
VVSLFLALLIKVVVFGDSPGAGFGDIVWVSTLVLPPYGFGVLVRVWDDRTQRTAEEAARLAAGQEQVRQETAAAERARIARELHDILAHSVSAMVVQASAAEDLLHRDPDRAARVLHDVAAVGRRALAETGRLLRLIRDPDDELGLEPDPGLDRLDDLLEGFRQNGMQIVLTVQGMDDQLPAGVDLSAYRVVQESLTNALRHGSGREASLSVVRRSDELAICVKNPLGPGDTSGSGLGLLGVAERVAVFGGSLRHGPTTDGGYALAVTLPIRDGYS